jgi:hypothetical protein
MLATHPEADATTHSMACRLARDLCSLGRGDAALVVLVDPVTARPLGRCTIGPRPDGGDGIVGLVLPTEPCVVDAARVHNAPVHLVADAWGTDRLLLVPCTFGNDLLAVAVLPVAADATPDRRLAAVVADRFAAALTRARLFGRLATAA